MKDIPACAAGQSNREVALDLAGRGFPVFPITLKDNGDWTPILGWQSLATTESAQIEEWFRDFPEARVGLICGERSGITVLDVDRKDGKDGLATLRALGFDPMGMSPVTTQTPSGGLHLFFKFDPRLKNWAGKLGLALDTRNTGGFVLAPGSWKDGARYEVVGAPLGSVELPAFPESLIPELEPEREPVEPVAEATDDQRRWAAERLARWAGELAEMAPETGRNGYLNSAAYWAGGAAAHGFITEDQAREALQAAARECGLKSREFRATFRSGFRKGLKDPISDYPQEIEDSDFEDLDDLQPASPFDDDLRDLLGESPPKPAGRLRFLTPEDCERAPARGYLIKGLVAPRDVGCIFGLPGAGKSLLAPHLGYKLAQGEDAFGMRSKGGGVLYVAAEDATGMRGRVKALRLANGDAPDFALVEGVGDLLAPGAPDLAALMAEVERRKPALIVIDTLAAAFSGLDENDAKSMGRVVAIARKLTEHGAAVLLVHHSTKAEGPSPRGHSILNGALDMSLHVQRGEGGVIRGALIKNRNGTVDRDIAFTIATEDGGTDEDGDTISLPRCEEMQLDPFAVKLKRPEREVARILKRLLDEEAEHSPDGNESISVTESILRDACCASEVVSGASDRRGRLKVYRRAFGNLVGQGIFSVFVHPDSTDRMVAFDKFSMLSECDL